MGPRQIAARVAASFLASLPLAVIVAVTAEAESPPVVDILDFLVNQRDYLGKAVTIKNCHFVFPSVQSITCAALKDGNSPGEILIDGPTLDRASLRRMINDCSAFILDQGPKCMGSITGTVYDTFAELGVKNYAILGIKNVTVTWDGS